MSGQLALKPHDFESRAVSPVLEMGAYEALWLHDATFKKIADQFRDNAGAIPSDFVAVGEALNCASRVLEIMRRDGVDDFGVRVHGAGEYPKKLREARHPVELLYFQGWWNLVEGPAVAIVGTRNPSAEGLARTSRLAKLLAKDGFTVVSGLAKGVDTMAHTAALEAGGATIAVIGTPLNRAYPTENAELQRRIGREFLVVSQVPILKYLQAKNPRVNSYFFPERNVTMSALTDATIIVEAGETSGTLYQARAAIDQGRRLFILDSCFGRGLSWPDKFLSQGAIRVRDYDDIIKHLAAPGCTTGLPRSTN
jgi:DNA processing protein